MAVGQKLASVFVTIGTDQKPLDKGLGKARNKLGRFVKGAGINVPLRVNTSPLGRAKGAIASFARDATRSLGPLLGMLGGGAAAGGAGGLFAAFQVGKTAIGFEQAMRSSLAIMGEVSDEMKAVMSETAQEIAAVTKFSAREAAESYFFLASAGLNAAQSVAALPAVARFAQAGMFDMSLATDLLTDAQSALGLTTNDTAENLQNMTRVSDVLVKANTLANASVQQFSESLTNRAAAALRAVNKEVEEGVAVLAAMADQGVKGALAGNQLAIAMRDLTTRGIKSKSQLAALGITIFDTSGNMRNMADIIGDMEVAFGGMNAEQKKATLLQLGFSDRSLAVIQVLLGTSQKIRDYEAALKSAKGTTAEVAGKQLPEIIKAWEEFKAIVTSLSITLGKIGLPIVTKLLKALSIVAGGIGAIFNGIGAAFSAAFGSRRLTELEAITDKLQGLSRAAQDAANARLGITSEQQSRGNKGDAERKQREDAKTVALSLLRGVETKRQETPAARQARKRSAIAGSFQSIDKIPTKNLSKEAAAAIEKLKREAARTFNNLEQSFSSKIKAFGEIQTEAFGIVTQDKAERGAKAKKAAEAQAAAKKLGASFIGSFEKSVKRVQELREKFLELARSGGDIDAVQAKMIEMGQATKRELGIATFGLASGLEKATEEAKDLVKEIGRAGAELILIEKFGEAIAAGAIANARADATKITQAKRKRDAPNVKKVEEKQGTVGRFGAAGLAQSIQSSLGGDGQIQRDLLKAAKKGGIADRRKIAQAEKNQKILAAILEKTGGAGSFAGGGGA